MGKASMDNKTMFKLTYGLYVLTTRNAEKLNGCIINTAIQQTSEPNRISITVNKANYTTGMIQKAKWFVVSVIDESADFSLFKHFGFQSGRDVDKFSGDEVPAYRETARGIPYITEGCNAYLSCYVEQEIDLGSHILFIAKVDDGETLSDISSATYSYYQEHIKPKPQAVKSAGRVWICKICGYVYDEAKEGIPFEELPDDWACPTCKHGKQDFELQR